MRAKMLTVWMVWLLLLGSTMAWAVTPPLGDYGDAPDGTNALYGAPFTGVIGKFPTELGTLNSRYGLPGGRTSASQEWFGASVSLEAGPHDGADPDSVENLVDDDFDNGLGGSACPWTRRAPSRRRPR